MMPEKTNTDHGSWVLYTPAQMPEGAPPNALFAKRASDGMDWYDYVNSGTSFGAGNVIIAAYWAAGQNSYVTGPATYDPLTIFPQGCIVHEIRNYNGTDPQKDLGSKCFDPATGIFTDPVMSATLAADDMTTQTLRKILERLDALESK